MPGNENPAEKESPNILVVEDREEDVFFLRRAFNSADLHPAITHVRDGEEAIRFLSRQPPYDDTALYLVPDVVVLDLKSPSETVLKSSSGCENPSKTFSFSL